MEIRLQDIAKQFGREQVFHGVNVELASGSRTAILGPNGSGKSTLLQVIGGILMPSHGTITHHHKGAGVPADALYRSISIAAPYLNLYEDLPLRQTIDFHARFKPLMQGITTEELARIAYLDHAMDKPVLHFSSGMKQRLKLALAILSDTPLLLLDEPASNLDAEAIAWYRDLLPKHAEGRTVVIASNRQAAEHELCDRQIDTSALK
ncbi:MAG: ABC transporter ATP-binding protein [Flavobacteriales bacterium]|nr:ABC transporter ATP-binding protein [Flavobacteriales bacterium]MCC6937113.1 ABC transporter ATP-binding protein [Flavobacteriales bacterium]